MELDERSPDLDAGLILGSEPELLVLLCGLLGRGGEERDVVEVVLDVRLPLDEPEPQAFGDVEVRAAVLAGHVNALERPERLLQSRHAERHVLQRAPLTRPLLAEERQLPAARICADELACRSAR